jgi:NodT family efflux transporter outer membrane factor (OMF) lipoprotein
MVGPNYKTPPAPVASDWVELPTTQPTTNAAPTTEPAADQSQQLQWWDSFHDPVLDQLVRTAYRQNLTLQVAGLRVLEARAIRGIEVGSFFPQVQSINASYAKNGISQNNPFITAGTRYFDSTSATFDVVWELDAWGKFRRGIESADATLYASVMNYDDALVTLVADVATTYVNLRGLDERIRLATKNVQVQQDSLNIANVRFKAGGTTELDVQQARAQLTNTQALIPALVQSRRQAQYQLCTLLGIPPQQLDEMLGGTTQPIPAPPDSIAIGIPAELLRRRPDIRRAEGIAAAQCAQIGVATADLLPHFQLFGTIGYAAENPGDLVNESSLIYQAGTGLRWDIFNYGRITNSVRVQDARFEQALVQYQNTVLQAQQEVANSINAFLRSREQQRLLAESVTAAVRSVELANTQYKAGGADFIRVLNATQFLVQQQDQLAVTQINEAAAVIALNKALGGGWELRQGHEFLAPEIIERMRHRTNWGNILSADYDTKKDLLFFQRPKDAVPTDPYPAGKK